MYVLSAEYNMKTHELMVWFLTKCCAVSFPLSECCGCVFARRGILTLCQRIQAWKTLTCTPALHYAWCHVARPNWMIHNRRTSSPFLILGSGVGWRLPRRNTHNGINISSLLRVVCISTFLALCSKSLWSTDLDIQKNTPVSVFGCLSAHQR